MSKKPPSLPGIVFEVGARLEAQDYLQKWYTSRIEKMDYEEGRMLIHFERWSHRYNEWIYWDSPRLRPLDTPSLKKETPRGDHDLRELRAGDEVLARWTDCRYYPAKIEDISKEQGIYTVQFYDGVIRSVKRIHIKSMPEDAKGQDWLALVKAATAATTKSKAIGKPPSHKDKEERRVGRGAHYRKDTHVSEVKQTQQHKMVVEPTVMEISGLTEPVVTREEVKPIPAPTPAAKRRQQLPTGSFQAKRARLNKITGLLASKAVSGEGGDLVEDGTGSQRVSDQLLASEASDRRRKTEAGESTPPASQGTRPLSLPPVPAPSPGKACTRKHRADETFGSSKPREPPPTPPAVPQGGNSPCVDFAQTLSPPSPPDTPQTGLRRRCLNPEELSVSRSSGSVPLDLSLTPSSSLAPQPPSKARLVNPPPPSTLPAVASLSSSLSGCPLSCTPAPVSHQLTSPPVTPVNRSLREPKTRVPVTSLGWGLCVGGRSAEAETLHQKLLRKCIDRDRRSEVGKKTARSKGKREKERTPNKTKKKKKKNKSVFGCAKLKDSRLCRLPGAAGSLALCPTSAVKPAFLSPKCLLPLGSLLGLSIEPTPKPEDLSSEEFLDGSSTESALGSEEWGQEPATPSPSPATEDMPSEEDRDEVVRCVCRLDEEKGFMIQCEDCLCWQHSVCMGLVEDSIPDQYTCPFCQNSTDQQCGSRFCYDEEWLLTGRMCGLSLLQDNYSHRNAKQILATHQLLADIYSVTQVLHSLQLKIDILQSQNHPDLGLWACSWVKTGEGSTESGQPEPPKPERPARKHSLKTEAWPGCQGDSNYITSEHSYQKPQDCGSEQRGPGVGHHHSLEPRASLAQHSLQPRSGAGQVSSSQREDGRSGKAGATRILPGADGTRVNMETQQGAVGEQLESEREREFQWRLNLLAHVEAVQTQVSHRMDVIEKELEGLENWLGYPGELEVRGSAMARLPQLKHHIRKLLGDLSRVQQLAKCCYL